MKCKLCGEDKILIDAHLIPKWVYKYIAKNENKYDLILVEKGKTKRAPIGTYDQNILCEECDGFIGRYDNYAKKVILDKDPERIKDHCYLLRGVDVECFLIFLLSVAWRNSISTKDEIKGVNIGAYEEIIRGILLDRKLKKYKISLDNYTFVVGKFKVGKLPDNIVNKSLQIPHLQKIQDVNVFVLYLPGGYKIFLKLDKRLFPNNLDKVSKAYNKDIIVLELKEYADSDEFKAMLSVI